MSIRAERVRRRLVDNDGDRAQRMIDWVEEHRDWINRQLKGQVVFHMAGKKLEVEVGLGREEI